MCRDEPSGASRGRGGWVPGCSAPPPRMLCPLTSKCALLPVDCGRCTKGGMPPCWVPPPGWNGLRETSPKPPDKSLGPGMKLSSGSTGPCGAMPYPMPFGLATVSMPLPLMWQPCGCCRCPNEGRSKGRGGAVVPCGPASTGMLQGGHPSSCGRVCICGACISKPPGCPFAGGIPMSKCIDTDWLDMTALSVTASDLEEEARPAPFRSRRGHLAMPCRRQARFSVVGQIPRLAAAVFNPWQNCLSSCASVRRLPAP
mmetsp:Transcript_4602/g.13227  ORF Transcript_4602/g.13227 Transcript_4602/m.13227 type:complete len:256 (+) Transcript_4602:678-1445(+)